MKKIYYIIFTLILFVPLGLYMTNKPAWGEWESEYYKKVLGFIPEGIKKSSQSAIIPDYNIAKLGSVPSYYVSALVGVALIFAIFYILKKFIKNA